MSRGCGLKCYFFIMAISVERKWYGTGLLRIKMSEWRSVEKKT